MDRLINWLVSEISNLWTKVNPIVQWLLSETSCLATKINPIVQRSMSYASYLVTKINPIVERVKERDTLLLVAGAVAAIAVVGMLWKMVFKGSGKTMKAPGRNYRMLRKDFERSPKDYFLNLRK